MTAQAASAVLAYEQSAPEGPTVGPAGWILNVCSLDLPERGWRSRGGDISATHPDRPGETSLVLNTSSPPTTGIPVAIAFGPDDAAYITDEGRRSIVRVAPDGRVEDFISEWQGAPLNGPNDLAFTPAGDLFFTDPWGSSAERPIGNLFGFDRASGELHRLRTGMRFPNGVAIRGDRLYVAETLTNTVWVWDIIGPGMATGERLFCRCPEVPDDPTQGPDGMCFDAAGNLYVAHIGTGAIVVFDSNGVELERIPTGGPRATNVCFGGPDHDQLFVTQDDLGQVLRFDIKVVGARLPYCPSLRHDHPWSARLPLAPA